MGCREACGALASAAREGCRRPGLRRGVLGGVLVAVCLALSAPVAGAECPTAPVELDPAPADAVVGELHVLRQELAASCAAIVSATADVNTSVAAGSSAAGADARTVEGLLTELLAHQGDPVALALGDARDRPLYVVNADASTVEGTVALSEGDRDAMHGDAEQLRFAVWFLAGMCAVMLASPIIRRVWLP